MRNNLIELYKYIHTTDSNNERNWCLKMLNLTLWYILREKIKINTRLKFRMEEERAEKESGIEIHNMIFGFKKKRMGMYNIRRNEKS